MTDRAIRAELEKVGLDVIWQPGSNYRERVVREIPMLRAYVHKAGLEVE